MNFKKFLSSSIASIMIISSFPPNIVLANDGDTVQDSKVTENQTGLNSTNINTESLNELKNERTSNTKTFIDDSGQFYKEIYAEPVHIKSNGSYEEINNAVTIDQSNRDVLATENTSLQAEFPKNLQNDNGIIFKKGPYQVEFELTGANQEGTQIQPNLLSKTTLEDNKVQYNEIYPGVDLRHITFNKEVKEDWIIKKYTGINQFSYTLHTKLKPILQQSGAIEFFVKDGDTAPVFTLPAPEMMDSNINENKGEGTYSKQLRYLLEKKSNDSYGLILDIDKNWLASNDRKYPVYVDPSVSIDALGDAYISSKYPTMNYNQKWDPVQGEYVLQTGYYDSTSGTNYAFIKFSVANELKGAVIDTATLQAYVTHAYYATQKNGLWVDEANSKWATNEITWNNKPSSTKISSTLVGRDEWAKLDVKNTLQAWVSEERTNTGFKLHTNGNGQSYWKKITASESANKPKLVISYHYDQMPVPTMSAQLDNATTKTGSVNVNWKSVFGASSYKLQMFDGYRYETVYTGSALSWTSKDKKMFPKAPFSSSSRYKLDGTGTELPVDPSAFYSANLGSATTTKAYKFRVVPVYPTGDGPTSTIISKEIPIPAGEPDLPTVTTGTYSETDTANKGRGWLNIKWNKVANATGYKVRIWNGSSYKNYSVGKDTLSISTKGKKIWPTDTQIQSGVKDLHDATLDDTTSVGKGSELPIDPSTTYGNSSSRYSVRVIATSAAGDSPSSDVNYGYMKLYAPKNVTVTANEDNLVQNKTSLTMKWSPSIGANYYEVQLNNGTSIEIYKVKGVTSFTTPKPTYDLGKQYSANVVAFFEDDDTAYETEEGKVSGQRGLSDKSSNALVQSSLREDLLGLENYFTYSENIVANALSYVNVTTGNLALQFTDESLYTRSELGYDFTRTYNSRSLNTSALGKGWTFIGNETLTELSNGDVLYEDEDGTKHLFKKAGSTFSSPKGLYETLVKENDSFVMSDENKFIQTFLPGKNTGKYKIASFIDENKNQINLTRNENDELIEVSEKSSASSSTSIKISYVNGKISLVNYADRWTKFEYHNDLLIKTTRGSAESDKTIVENYLYSPENRLIKYIDGELNETSFTYIENEISIFDKQEKDETLSVTNTYKFNENENEYTETDSSDVITTYKRDKANNSYTVSQKEEPTEEQESNIISYNYDSQFNLTKITDNNGTVEESVYDQNGNLLSLKNDEGITTNIYNDDNQLIKSIAPNGEVTLNTYVGPNLITVQKNNEKTTMEYDNYGRLIKSVFPNKTFQQTIYDDELRKVTNIDKNGNKTSVIYSLFDQKIQETDADQNSTSYSYDSLYVDSISSVIDGNGNKTSYNYDSNNNLLSLSDALNRTKNYNYNDNDQATSIIGPRLDLKYEYDQDGNLSQSKTTSGITTNYSYNIDGEINTVIVGNEKIEYLYDENGNVNSILKNNVNLKSFNHAESSALLSYTLGAFSQNYKYDSQERIVEILNDYNQDFKVSQQVTYKENSDQLEYVQYSFGENLIRNYKNENDSLTNQYSLTLNEDLFKRILQVDDTNYLKSIVYKGKEKPDFKVDYTYTNNGKINSESINGKTNYFEYDGNSQLVKERLFDQSLNSYSYDSVGNRTESDVRGKKTVFTYNDSNQIIKKNSFNYEYDLDGNLIKDENYTYLYNEQHYLKEVKTHEGKLVSSYSYDENGLRLSKIIGNKKHEYYYNNEVLDLEVIRVNNEIQSYKFYEWSNLLPLGMIVKEKNDTGIFEMNAYQFITNQRGDVLSIRDNNNNEVGSYQYDAFGNIVSTTGAVANSNSIRYAGYYYDNETKHYYLQARYYNPENGQFNARDSHPGIDDDPATQNGYNYANGNPVMLTDHTGKIAVVIARALLAAAKPLIRKYGPKTLEAARYYMRRVAKRYFKKWSNYEIQINGGSLVKVVKKGVGRVFSIDYHAIPTGARLKKKKKKDEKYNGYVWHYHYRSDVHYVLREFLPRDVYIIESKKYKLVW